MVKRYEGQIQTVEAITAALILISVLAIVVEATSVTPLTSSFTNQHVKLELQNIGADILTSMDETAYAGAPTTNPNVPSYLKKSVTDWINCTGGYEWYAWSNNSSKYVPLINSADIPLDTPLSNTLSFLISNQSNTGAAYNVEVRYSNIQGQIMNTKMIWNGDPSENSVTVSRVIVLHDQDLAAPDSCVIPDISPNTTLHNVIEIRLTMWVM